MKGIRRTPQGWQVFAKRKGKFLSERFPLETEPHKLKQARERLIGLSYVPVALKAQDGQAFEDDADAYLKLVTAMPSYDDRTYDIGQWAQVFRGRARATITSREIREALEDWRLTGRADGAGGLSPGSLNRRRTALMHLYTTLDGRSAANAVKDVPRYDESASEKIRALPPRVLARIIARVGKHAWKSRRPEFRGTAPKETKTKVRLWLMLCTGWPPAQIMRLTAADIDWKHEAVWIGRRRKGKGAKGRMVPLVPGAINAVRKFVDADGWGAFSTSGVHKAFQRALAEENAWRARWKQPAVQASPYGARHTFGTELAKVVKDERVIMEMMLLGNLQQVRRYTEAATADRLEMARMALHVGAKVAKPQRRLPKDRKPAGLS